VVVLKYEVVFGFVVAHLIAGLAFFPWFFTWTGVMLLIAGLFIFGMLGINLGYHRLLTHRSLSCPLWLERTLSILGVCCLQDSPARWAAMHRRHHTHADNEQDPHTPVVSFFWAHAGWLLTKNREITHEQLVYQYAKDILQDPLQVWLEWHRNWFWIAAASWAAFFLGGFSAVALSGGSTSEALRFGTSLLIWGAALRTVVFWHLTWAVNSVGHRWGYRNYETPDASRNNAIIALLVHGEGWHNNHHAEPRSARHGHRWWEFDLTWLTIRCLMSLGLASDVTLPSRVAQAIRRLSKI
jgi:fatty-acid desaturase